MYICMLCVQCAPYIDIVQYANTFNVLILSRLLLLGIGMLNSSMCVGQKIAENGDGHKRP